MSSDAKAVTRWMPEHYGSVKESEYGTLVLFTDHERVVGELQKFIEDAEHDNIVLEAALDASRAEVEGLKKDAERYRWLTTQNDWDVESRVLEEDGVTLSVTVYSPKRLDKWGELDDIDSAIDAAMEKGNV